jgi:hypothetical protein
MDPIALDELLEAMAEFEDPNGVSLEFVAWELHQPNLALLPAWQRAKDEHLIEPAGWDPEQNEQLWRRSSAANEESHNEESQHNDSAGHG